MSREMETPKEHWKKIRHIREQSQSSLEEDSNSFICRFMDIVNKSNETSQLTQQKLNNEEEYGSKLDLSIEK